MTPSLPLSALLGYIEEEARRWEIWFRDNPAAADAKLDIAHASTAKAFVNHIFMVEYRYGQWITNETPIAMEHLDRDTMPEIFQVGEQAREKIKRFLNASSDADVDRPVTFKTLTSGEFTVSARKMLTHAMIHSVRHWAQLSTALRQQGFRQHWKHDFLFTSAID